MTLVLHDLATWHMRTLPCMPPPQATCHTLQGNTAPRSQPCCMHSVRHISTWRPHDTWLGHATLQAT